MQQLDLIAIDLDGTLVDTLADLHESVVRMQNALGLDSASVDDVRNWVGNGIERLVHRALTDSMSNNADPQVFKQALAEFSQAYEEVNGTRSNLYPGVQNGLQWLSSLDVPLVMVTNKARQFAIPLLKRLNIFDVFNHCIAGDDVTSKKPHPEALLLAARFCSAAPAQSVMIGDSIHDIKAAYSAGFTSIGVSYGYNHGYALNYIDDEWRPAAVVDSFDELSVVIPGMFAAK